MSDSSVPGWVLLRAYLKTNSGDDLVSPLFQDPETGEFWLFRIRQLRNAAGEPIGLIIARQSPEALMATFSQLSLSEGQSIAILDESMRLVARRPLEKDDKDILGKKVSELNTRQFIESGQRSVQVITESPVDGLSRFYAFRRG